MLRSYYGEVPVKRRLPSSLETTWHVVRCSFQLVVKAPLTTRCHVVRTKAVGFALGVKCCGKRDVACWALHIVFSPCCSFHISCLQSSQLDGLLLLNSLPFVSFFLSLCSILLVDLKGSVSNDVIKCIIICMMLDETMLVRLD